MGSYQNTSEYYCGMPTMDLEHCTNTNVFLNGSPTNYQMHRVVSFPEGYEKQGVYPTMSPRGMTCNPAPYETSHFYENPSAPQYNLIEYTSFTPEPVSYPVFHLEPRRHLYNNYMAKRQLAQITILPSSRKTFKAKVVKRKRKRTAFTTEQVEALEDIFKTKRYVSREEREVIVNKLQLNDKSVKIWFQNRRLKIKKMQAQNLEEQEDCSSAEYLVEERSSTDIARLDSVESQISKKTDEYGFVTLDDGIMADLYNAIDNSLTKTGVDVPVEEVVGINSSPVYEPISPVSIIDSNVERSSACWAPSEPNESLQRLFDLQTMLLL